MGDRSHVILEKSRTVRRRYQRRKQQVQFSKAELERLERSDEKERRAKKLQEQEKRRVANKKKRLEKEALAREERKKSGLPDPNAKISASQQLLSNFFGMKAGGTGVRDKSESTGEDGGDTEVDSDDDCGSGKSTSPDEGPDCAEVGGTESDDSFDDDDALMLFNDENVLKGINGSGNANEALEIPTRKHTESMPTSRRISSRGDGNKPHVPSGHTSGADKKQVPDQLGSIPATDANGDRERQHSATGVKLGSQAKKDAGESDPFDLVEEILSSGSASVTPKAHVTAGTMQSPQETPTSLYQDAEDVLAGLCTQDFDDDDVEEGSNKAPSPNPKLNGQHAPCDKQPVESTRPPLCDLAPTSLNTKKVTTSQKQIDTSKATPQPQTATTTTISDEYGSFSFDDEDLLYLGV